MEYVDLIEFGLTENEAKIYLTLLRLGSVKVSLIAEKSGVLRTFVYEVLDSLSKKGLVGYVIKSGVRYYEAADPDRLKTMIKEKESKLETIIPSLKSLKKLVKEKPKVGVYEGKEGLKTILEDILNSKPNIIYAYANYDIFKILRFYFPNFVKRRVTNKIKARVIQERVSSLIRAKEKDIEELREIKFFPIRFESNVFIYNNKVVLMTLSDENLLGVVVENEEIAETQKQVFDVLWKAAKA